MYIDVHRKNRLPVAFSGGHKRLRRSMALLGVVETYSIEPMKKQVADACCLADGRKVGLCFVAVLSGEYRFRRISCVRVIKTNFITGIFP